MKSKPELSNLTIQDSSAMDSAIEGYVQAINNFQENSPTKLPDELEQFLLHVAKTGDIISSWEKVRKVFLLKMKQVLDEFYETEPYKSGKVHSNCENDPFDEMRERLIQLTDEFESPPFTFQRLCELITNPRKNYTKCEKFMRAVEKNLMVVSSWNYPTRRSSEGMEQVNGGFDSRTSYNSIDRPWSTLPHSPVTTSAPTIPEVVISDSKSTDKETESTKSDLKKDDNGAEVEIDADKTPAEILNKEDSQTKDDDSTSTEVDKTAEVCDAAKDTCDVDEATTSEVKDSDEAEVKAADTQVHIPAKSDSTDNKVTASLSGFIANTMESGDSLMNSGRMEEKKEPLPGVGTLVEKHNVIKCAKQPDLKVQSEAKGDVNEASDNKPDSVITTPHPTCDGNSEVAMTTHPRSPKRKLSEEEVPMEIGSPTKRPKHDDDVAMTSPEKD